MAAPCAFPRCGWEYSCVVPSSDTDRKMFGSKVSAKRSRRTHHPYISEATCINHCRYVTSRWLEMNARMNERNPQDPTKPLDEQRALCIASTAFKTLRKVNELTQKKLAREMSLERSEIAKIESCETLPPLSLTCKIFDKFGVYIQSREEFYNIVPAT